MSLLAVGARVIVRSYPGIVSMVQSPAVRRTARQVQDYATQQIERKAQELGRELVKQFEQKLEDVASGKPVRKGKKSKR